MRSSADDILTLTLDLPCLNVADRPSSASQKLRGRRTTFLAVALVLRVATGPHPLSDSPAYAPTVQMHGPHTYDTAALLDGAISSTKICGPSVPPSVTLAIFLSLGGLLS